MNEEAKPNVNAVQCKKEKSPGKSPDKGKRSVGGSSTKSQITGNDNGLKASNPKIVLECVEMALNNLTSEQRNQVAQKYGIAPNLLHMNWATVQKKKVLKLVKESLGSS